MTSTDELSILVRDADSVDGVSSLQPHLISDIITKTENKHLFPSGRFCVDYHPFSVERQNIEIIQNQWKVLFTFDPTWSGKCQAISFLSYYEGENARCINAEIYTANISGNAVIRHIIKAVDSFQQMDDYNGELVLELQFHPDLSERVDHFTNLAGLVHTHYANNYLLMEKVI